MRCLALAQAWMAQGGQAIFLSHCESALLIKRIQSSNADFNPIQVPHPAPEDLQTTRQLLTRLRAEHPTTKLRVIVDGYHFDPDYHQELRNSSDCMLIVDDYMHQPAYNCHLLLNQNVYAPDMIYPCNSDTTLLLGTQYALLRTEFAGFRDWVRPKPQEPYKLLVTLGGSDPENVTIRVLEAIAQLKLPELNVRLIIGPSNPHITALEHAAASLPNPIEILTNISNMAEMMAWADLAVSAGGSTCWELAFMGLPTIIIVLAENQYTIAQEMAKANAAVSLGRCETLSVETIITHLQDLLSAPERMAAMSVAGRHLVDGHGVQRVVAALAKC